MRRRTIHSIIMLVLLIIMGLVAIFKPEIFIKIQYWQLRDVHINTKTLLIYRGIGIFLTILSSMELVKMIKTRRESNNQ